MASRKQKTLRGFFVPIPTANERIKDLTRLINETANEDLKLRLQQQVITLQNALDSSIQKNVSPPFALSGETPEAPKPPPVSSIPVPVPIDEWQKSGKSFRVVYDFVNVRASPTLRSDSICVLTKNTLVTAERETDHWVKLQNGGWVLKHQKKYGALLLPVKKQHYEHKYAPAVTVFVDAQGHVVPPATPTTSGRILPERGLNIPKRVIIEAGKLGQVPPPPPPPRGFEVLLDRGSGLKYYATTSSQHPQKVYWTLGAIQRI